MELSIIFIIATSTLLLFINLIVRVLRDLKNDMKSAEKENYRTALNEEKEGIHQ